MENSFNTLNRLVGYHHNLSTLDVTRIYLLKLKFARIDAIGRN